MLVSAVFAFVVAAAPAPALLLPAQPVGEPIDCNGPVFKSQIYRDDVECREVERRKLSIQDQTVTLRILADDEEDAELPPEYREAAVEAIARAFGIVAGERKLNFHNVSVLPVQWRQDAVRRCSPATPSRPTSSVTAGLAVPLRANSVPMHGSSTAHGRICRPSPMRPGWLIHSTPMWYPATGWADRC